MFINKYKIILKLIVLIVMVIAFSFNNSNISFANSFNSNDISLNPIIYNRDDYSSGNVNFEINYIVANDEFNNQINNLLNDYENKTLNLSEKSRIIRLAINTNSFIYNDYIKNRNGDLYYYFKINNTQRNLDFINLKEREVLINFTIYIDVQAYSGTDYVVHIFNNIYKNNEKQLSIASLKYNESTFMKYNNNEYILVTLRNK